MLEGFSVLLRRLFWIDCDIDSALFTAQVEVLLVVVGLGGAVAHESVHLS